MINKVYLQLQRGVLPFHQEENLHHPAPDLNIIDSGPIQALSMHLLKRPPLGER